MNKHKFEIYIRNTTNIKQGLKNHNYIFYCSHFHIIIHFILLINCITIYKYSIPIIYWISEFLHFIIKFI